MSQNNLYTRAYAVGYYYGRLSVEVAMTEQDQVYRNLPAFQEGFANGVTDFLEIDLPISALAEQEHV